MTTSEIKQAVTTLKDGGIIAYPTEAIYGIGCDPFNEEGVLKVFKMKQRPMNKGLILIASDFSQLEDLITPTEHMTEVLQTWPGPNTWIFPVTSKVPKWLLGEFNSIAVRVTDHPLASTLCAEFGGPIVSTSANVSSASPAKTWQELSPELKPKLDYILKGDVGDLDKCSSIRDARTFTQLR